ncbi:hypothetical protein HF086_010006 [Spodoptera exigua]|uniref:PSMD12/CSN4-like N-terminal domain-containing protein n=1 Tax=Spodoptera exigua TaxID=7107 RepID=A0A922MMJ2_SPOEX|nr:hypothetical protein HF086_010006 [Spodoptera exigua]
MPINLQGVRQYLSELRNSGGLHKDQAEKYRNVLMEILKSTETELAESLKAFVEAIVNENVSLVISRQLLTDVSTHLALLPDLVSQEVSHFALDVIQPRVISFEEQVASIRQHLADIYERNQNWKEAANVLVGIPLETGQKQYSVDYKLETYLKIARLYLEVDDPVQAEAFVNRASLLQAETTNEQLQIYYKVCYARVLDYRRTTAFQNVSYLIQRREMSTVTSIFYFGENVPGSDHQALGAARVRSPNADASEGNVSYLSFGTG